MNEIKMKKEDATLLTDEPQMDQELSDLLLRMAQNAETVENSLAVIKNTEPRIEEMKDLRHKFFLTGLYAQQKFKQDYAMASLIKGILVQNRMFFAFSKDTLPKAVEIDLDNTNKGKSFEMKAFCKLLAKNGIVQLWDAQLSTIKGKQKVAGYLVFDATMRGLLKINNEQALAQFRELKKLAGNDWVTEEMVFDSCGGLSIKPEVHRLLVEARRTKVEVPRAEGKAVSNGSVDENSEPIDSSPDVTAAIQNDELYKKLMSSVGRFHVFSLEGDIKRIFKDFHSSYLELDKDSFISYLKDTFKTSLLSLANNLEFSDSHFKTSISRFFKKFGYSDKDTDELSSRFLEAVKTV